jgi:hypothetical protein
MTSRVTEGCALDVKEVKVVGLKANPLIIPGVCDDSPCTAYSVVY